MNLFFGSSLNWNWPQKNGGSTGTVRVARSIRGRYLRSERRPKFAAAIDWHFLPHAPTFTSAKSTEAKKNWSEPISLAEDPAILRKTGVQVVHNVLWGVDKLLKLGVQFAILSTRAKKPRFSCVDAKWLEVAG
jgi:hypothetical protein